MIIGISRETFPSEKRVALTPESVKSLFDKDFEVMVESGAGKFSGFS
ncbi:MAG: NAD(P)(+) transhydrogenase (Re/Si-specific) subunit alpha, partial [candidate division WOR-3 bacterium]